MNNGVKVGGSMIGLGCLLMIAGLGITLVIGCLGLLLVGG